MRNLLAAILLVAAYAHADQSRRMDDSGCVLLAHFEGADATTAVVDETGRHRATANADAQIDTAQSAHGGSSALFDGTGDYVSFADSDDWNLSGSWTIRFSVRADLTTYVFRAVSQRDDDDNYWSIHVNTTGSITAIGVVAASAVFSYSTNTGVISSNTWADVTVSWDGTTMRCFKDGAEVTFNEATAYSAFPSLSGELHLGRLNTTYAVGHLDELQIIKGRADTVITGVSRAPFQSKLPTFDPRTVLLAPFFSSGDLARNGFAPHAISYAGGASLETSVSDPFGHARTVLDFTADGEYCDIADGGDFTFEGDFTVEFWYYASTHESYQDIVGTASNSAYLGASKGGWVIAYYHGGTPYISLLYQYNNAAPFSQSFTTTLATSQWYHIAMVRNGSDWKCYVDGTDTGDTGSYASTITSTEGYCRVGNGYGQTTTGDAQGYVSGLRISKGIARYTGNFTPPTGPHAP